MEIEKKIRTFLESEFMTDKPEHHLLDDESLIEKGIIDSLGIMKLVSFLEEEFQIKVRDEEFVPENFETISKLHNYLKTKINQ